MNIRQVLILTILPFALSACGKDSKKSTPSPVEVPKPVPSPTLNQTFYHFPTDQGVCSEIIREEWVAKGALLPPELVKGPCPETVNILGQEATRFASCPGKADAEFPMTTVFYSKIVNAEDGTLFDAELIGKEVLCQSVLES